MGFAFDFLGRVVFSSFHHQTVSPKEHSELTFRVPKSLLYLGLIVGTVISEVLFSGSLSDWIVIRQAKSNNGQKTPEMRLWLAYPAAVLTAVGLVVWGVSVDRGYHWMVGQVAFALCKSSSLCFWES